MLLDYAYENDSLKQVVSISDRLDSDTTTSAKTGLSWWQKTQIIGFWVLLAGMSLSLGVGTFTSKCNYSFCQCRKKNLFNEFEVFWSKS
ncbi:MAG: hypothetical protein FWD66_09130 [Paludibacter sp.]|nr:hypothetical protein [Paludibacter sp.]